MNTVLLCERSVKVVLVSLQSCKSQTNSKVFLSGTHPQITRKNKPTSTYQEGRDKEPINKNKTCWAKKLKALFPVNNSSPSFRWLVFLLTWSFTETEIYVVCNGALRQSAYLSLDRERPGPCYLGGSARSLRACNPMLIAVPPRKSLTSSTSDMTRILELSCSPSHKPASSLFKFYKKKTTFVLRNF